MAVAIVVVMCAFGLVRRSQTSSMGRPGEWETDATVAAGRDESLELAEWWHTGLRLGFGRFAITIGEPIESEYYVFLIWHRPSGDRHYLLYGDWGETVQPYELRGERRAVAGNGRAGLRRVWLIGRSGSLDGPRHFSGALDLDTGEAVSAVHVYGDEREACWVVAPGRTDRQMVQVAEDFQHQDSVRDPMNDTRVVPVPVWATETGGEVLWREPM
ncbi:MAG: hypothetical protein HYU66_01145 [Armatimonadetes bacterium]|nr:hypothetical protein [Armatimonadota bacterium]